MRWLFAPVLVTAALFVAGASAKTPESPPWGKPIVAPASWAGLWVTNWGTMRLTQKGTHVTGTYFHDNGRIKGEVIGRTLSGNWSEEPSYAGPGDAGTVNLQLSPSGLQFTGKWSYKDGTSGGRSTGVRIEI